jgi:hypothetical protein
VSGSAILTISTTGSAAQGSYYFKLKESSVTSSLVTIAVTWLHVISPQSGSIKAGTGGSAKFTVPNCSSAGDCFITWCSSDGSAPSSVPTGITNIPDCTNAVGHVNITGDTTVIAGTYYFKLINGSAIATLTINAAGP